MARGERGSAPVLAVFTIFTLLSCTLAISSFQASDQRSVSATQQLVAADVTRATASTIEGELNQALSTAVTAAMYEVGSAGEDREDVKQLTLEYLNRRISHGWSYPNLVVRVPEAGKDDIKFEWQPDGSVRVRGYLGAEIKHIYGPTAHGTKLEASLNPRFERLKGVSELASSSAASIPDLEALESELNECYAAEGLAIELREDNGYVNATVSDVFGAPCAVVDGTKELVRYTSWSQREISLPPPVEGPPSPPQPSPPPNPPPPEPQPPSPEPGPGPTLGAQGDFILSISPPSGSVTRELGRVQFVRYEEDPSKPIYGWMTKRVWEVVGSHQEPVYGWVMRFMQVKLPIYGWVIRYIQVSLPSGGYIRMPYPSWEVVSHQMIEVPYPSWERVGTRTVDDYGWVTEQVWGVVGYEQRRVVTYGDGYPGRSTSARVTVTPIDGYSHEVSLSLSLPGGIDASLGSRSLKPNPHEVSTPLTVEVPVSVDPRTGAYVVRVVGEGADGKRRGASYDLSVLDLAKGMGPIEVSLQGQEGISILPVLDGGSATRGYFVLPSRFLPGPNTFVIPEDPELAELFALQGYIDYSTGEVKPLLPGELPGISFENFRRQWPGPN